MSIFLDQFNILLLILLNESLLQIEEIEDVMLMEDGRGMGESASNRTGDDERETDIAGRSCFWYWLEFQPVPKVALGIG